MKQLFAYIRVSTAKQGQGVSLQEQRAAIERYAAKTGAEITLWFEERQTAAKIGRPEFARMVKLLRAGKAQGVVIHKIDRSTRNYRDWAEIDELIDDGTDVFFANEDVDLRSRGGRLAADIQMVVAVDYIRNLREEALKGIHGRLKQGILPHGAPIGYVDRGAGRAKTIDPQRGPIIRRLFEQYATGRVTLRDLTEEAERLGLRNRGGQSFQLTQIQKMMRNPFYSGIIKSKRFGLFRGAHEPIVEPALFDVVQGTLDGKRVRRTKRFEFPFRRLIRCSTCGRSLIGSERKGSVYYRCQTQECPTTSLREDAIDSAFRTALASIVFAPEEVSLLEEEISLRFADDQILANSRRVALEQTLGSITSRLTRLTDLLLDCAIDPSTHDENRARLQKDRCRVEQELASLSLSSGQARERVERVLQIVKSVGTMYDAGDAEQKRELLAATVATCAATGKQIEISLHEPFAAIARTTDAQTSFRSAGSRISADEIIAWSIQPSGKLGLQNIA